MELIEKHSENTPWICLYFMELSLLHASQFIIQTPFMWDSVKYKGVARTWNKLEYGFPIPIIHFLFPGKTAASSSHGIF